MFVFCFQELLVIHFLFTVVPPLPPKIRIMTAAAETVLCTAKEPGGTRTVITPTWTVCIITDNTRQWLMVSTGITRKVISTPPRELRWKSDQWTHSFLASLLADQHKQSSVKKKCLLSDWVIKISEKWVLLSFLVFIVHFVLLSLVCLSFFRSPILSRYLVLFGLKIML